MKKEQKMRKREAMQRYFEKHKERIMETRKERYKKVKEDPQKWKEYQEYQKTWREENKKRLKFLGKKFRKENPTYHRDYYRKNKEKIKNRVKLKEFDEAVNF